MTKTSESRCLRVEDLSVAVRGPAKNRPVTVVERANLTVSPGKILGMIGESGSGKTMVCRAIAGALPSAASRTGGRVSVDGQEYDPGRQKQRRGGFAVGMVFADPLASLDPLQRAGDQIIEMLTVHRDMGRGEASGLALDLLSRVEIDRPELVSKKYPFELSGGMAQRLMIATVLAGSPRYLLADEATSALDATTRLRILELMRSVVEEEHMGVLLTTHDIALAGRASEDIVVMYAGSVVERGPAASILADPTHPYTRLLIKARPSGDRSARLTAIGGETPPASDWGEGCNFAPRCPYATDVCRVSDPPLVQVGDHVAACHHAEDISKGIR